VVLIFQISVFCLYHTGIDSTDAMWYNNEKVTAFFKHVTHPNYCDSRSSGKS
jgi:hypothetical protein